MTIGLLKQIADKCPLDARLMGIDVGAKTLGLAVGSVANGIATPLSTVKRGKFSADMQEIAKLCRGYETGGFVLGLPLSADGTEGRRCQSVRDFAAEMQRHLAPILGGDPWIALWDERFSTDTVENFVDDVVGIRRRQAKERGITDKLAAQSILQGALDYISQNSPLANRSVT